VMISRDSVLSRDLILWVSKISVLVSVWRMQVCQSQAYCL